MSKIKLDKNIKKEDDEKYNEDEEDYELIDYFNQITFNLDSTYDIQEFSDICVQERALSVTIQDAKVDLPDETPMYGEPGYDEEKIIWQQAEIIVLLDQSITIEQFIAEISCYIFIPPYTTKKVEQENWVELTQSQFKPIKIGNKLIITPSWHMDSFEEDRTTDNVIVKLDPGLAFGTGTHPTTFLCLSWLEQNLKSHVVLKILDYGCGSGILAITANKISVASTVYATDIDKQALQATKYNNKQNYSKVNCLSPKNLQKLNMSHQFNLVMANILTNPLKVLAPLLISYLFPRATLLLSGILAHQAAEVKKAYKPYNISLKVYQEHEGWVCMVGRLKPPKKNDDKK